MEVHKISNDQDLQQYTDKKNTKFLSWKTLLIHLSWFHHWISNIDFIHSVELIFTWCTNNINFEKVKFGKNILIWDIELIDHKIWLRFEWCTFDQEFQYDDRNKSHIFDIITFNSCVFDGRANFRWIESDQLNFFWNYENHNFLTVFNKGCFIYEGKIDQITFIWVKILNWILIDKCFESNISISAAILTWNFLFREFDTITINNLHREKDENQDILFQFQLSEKNKDSKIDFSNINSDIRCLLINDWANAVIENIKLVGYNTKIEISDIILTNTEIKNSNLDVSVFNWVVFSKLQIENVNLSDSIFNGCDFSENLESIWNNKKQKDNYRQLKFVMDKNGNKTEANKFYEMEMRTHLECLRDKKILSKWWFNKIYREWYYGQYTKDVSDYISLKFGQITSEFGNNWISPLIIIFVLAIFATCIQFISIDWFAGLKSLFTSIYQGVNGASKNTDIILGELLGWVVAVLFMLWCAYKIKKYILAMLAFLLFYSYLIYIVEWYSLLSNFLDFLSPLYGFWYSNDEWKCFSGIEKLSVLLYKTFYGIFLYYLIVAAKRTTRR